jgi:outer membrane protein
MHIRTIIIALFFSASLLPATAQQKYTLLECIDIALENNRNIKQQEIGRQQREIAYSQARADLLPNLNASAGQNLFVLHRPHNVMRTPTHRNHFCSGYQPFSWCG